MGRPNVTSADVAKAAGVSRATVSYVLNGVEARVSDQTRDRVLTVARELGYVPHAFASALRAGRTSVVVIALPAWPLGPPVAEMISALVAEVDRLGYTPLVHFRHWAGPDGLAKACDRVRPVGLLAPAGDLAPERVEALRANGTRAIIALAGEPMSHVPTLVFDQGQVGELAIEHLADRGHTHVLAILPTEPELVALGEQRLAGARAAASARGVTITPGTAEDLGDATAIFAFNDEYALAAVERLHARHGERRSGIDRRGAGATLPGGIAVVGVDDSPAARVAHLTTIKLVPVEVWAVVAQRLHAFIDDEDADSAPIVTRPTLMAGATT